MWELVIKKENGKKESFLGLKSLSEYTEKQSWQGHFITDALKIASLLLYQGLIT